MGVVFKGAPTYHKVTRDEDSGAYMVNNKGFGTHSALSSLIEHLGTSNVKGWPVPLTAPIASGGGDGGGSGDGSKSNARSPLQISAVWYQPAMKKEDAESHLISLGLQNGQFVVRGNPGKQLLSVVYKGKPTHHRIDGGGTEALTINKKQYGRVLDSLQPFPQSVGARALRPSA